MMNQVSVAKFPVKNLPDNLPETLSKMFKESKWVSERRKVAFELFKKMRTDETVILAKYTDFRDVFLEQLDWLVPLNVSEEDVGNLLEKLDVIEDDFIILLLDGKVVLTRVPERYQELGVLFTSLMDAYHSHFSYLVELLEKYPDIIKGSRFAAFNQALYNSGIFLKIPKNVQVDVPIRIIHVQKQSRAAVVSHHVITSELGSKATIFEEFYSYQREKLEKMDFGLYSIVTTVEVGPNSNLSFATIQDLNDHVIFFLNRQVHGLRDGNVSWATSFIGSHQLRAKIDYDLIGTGSSALDLELLYGSEVQRFHSVTFMHHRANHTQGVIHARMVADESARVIFNGMGRILEDAPFSNSSLDCHGLLLTKKSRIDAFPGLEIENNEVSASHSASTSPIDEEQIFYMRTRGINPEEAETLIIHGFMEAVIRQIPNEVIKNFFRRLGHMKWERAKYHDESITFGTVVPSLKVINSDLDSWEAANN